MVKVQRAEETFSDNLGHIFWNFSTFQKCFCSPQVMRYQIFFIKTQYTSFLTRCRTTQVLGFQKIRKYQEKVKFGVDTAWSTVFLQQIKLLQQQSKITQKQLSKFFTLVQFCLISFLCFKYYVHHCSIFTNLFLTIKIKGPQSHHKY